MTKLDEDNYEFIVETLRFFLSNDVPIFTVIADSRDALAKEGTGGATTNLTVQIDNLPFGRSEQIFPMRVSVLKAFFVSPEFRTYFLKWYAKHIGLSLQGSGASNRLVKRFLKLAPGRPGKLPPKLYLKHEYERLLLEIEIVRSAEFSKNKRDSLLEFGRSNKTAWLQALKDNEVSVGTLLRDSKQGVAKQILARKYHCSEESIHRRLFS